MRLKKKWLDGRLPLLIGYVPQDLQKSIVLPAINKNHFYYDLVTDQKIIIDEQISKGFYYFGGAIIVLSLIISILTWEFSWFSIILMTIGFFFCLYAYIVPKKEVILNRKESLFTFPNWFLGKPHTILFSKTKAVWSSTGGTSGALGMDLMVKHPKGPKGTQIGMHTKGFEEDWSFMVWYMDKNRPLPPGDAFDIYREKDFKRRKSEGFPPPLYKSKVQMPEATPSQQIERNAYWLDKEHYGNSESAWY